MATRPLLDLAEFDISPMLGFLSPETPLQRLPSTYYNSWEDLVSNLASLVSSKQIREHVRRLPLLATDHLSTQQEWKRAYVVLGFLLHAFVWMGDVREATIPMQLAEPFLEVCEHLRMQPVLSYAGSSLWNWQARNNGDPSDVDKLNPTASFTGTRDEAVFDLVPDAVEAIGGPLIPLLLKAVRETTVDSSANMTAALRTATQTLYDMQKPLSLLYRDVKPGLFYHQIRPFFGGGAALPNGMIFERKDGTHVSVKSTGDSAAQSSLFPFLDIVLGIKHRSGTKEVLEDMRPYMPGKHRRFLEAVSHQPNIREYVAGRNNDLELQDAYETCLKALRSWRSKHIAAVSTFVLRPSRGIEERANAESGGKDPSEPTGFDDELKGTGGASLIPFLKQSRDETTFR